MAVTTRLIIFEQLQLRKQIVIYVAILGSIATAGGLVFIGATNDARFRAFDSKTGKLLWEEKLEASGHTSPITYMGRDGRQYVALMAAGGGAFLGGPLSNSLVAFALPDVSRKPLPVSVSKAVALLPANRPCRLLGQVLSSKIFVTNRGPIYQVVKPQCKNYEVLTF